jgi:hypothetical protein
MTRRWARGGVLVLAVIVAGCSEAPVPSLGGPTADGSVQPQPSQPGSSQQIASIPPHAAPTIDPALLGGITLTCGDGLDFPAELLAGAGQAESETDSASQALRTILTGPDGTGLPSTGWHRVINTPSSVQFVAPDGAGWSMVQLTAAAGGWFMDLSGACSLGPALPDGVGQASWWLDPAAGPPPADATFVAALVLEEACASGKSPAGRVLPPVISASDVTISVMMAIRHRPGSQDCSGNSPMAITIDLGEAIGSRKLLDAGEFPPRDATVIPNH